MLFSHVLATSWFDSVCVTVTRWVNFREATVIRLQLEHSNLAYVLILLFVNIKLLIDSCLSKGFSGQLHEALRKCIGMILV